MLIGGVKMEALTKNEKFRLCLQLNNEILSKCKRLLPELNPRKKKHTIEVMAQLESAEIRMKVMGANRMSEHSINEAYRNLKKLNNIYK